MRCMQAPSSDRHHCHMAYPTRQISYPLHMCRLLCQTSECEYNSVRRVKSWCNPDLGRTTRIWRHYWGLVQSSLELLQQQLQLQQQLCYHCEQYDSMGRSCSIHLLLCLSESGICPLSVHLFQWRGVFLHRRQSGWVHSEVKLTHHSWSTAWEWQMLLDYTCTRMLCR